MPPEKPVNILLVDDRPENLLSLEAILEGVGGNLVKAPSSQEALKFLLRNEAAVILLDAQMPDMDGFETAALIREREKLQDTPIIFVTAIYKSSSHVLKGYSVGAVDYICKPFEPDILRPKVQAFITMFWQKQAVKEEAERLRQTNHELYKKSKTSEERYRLLMENVKDYAIFMLDPEGRVDSWNIGAERILGYAESEILGQHFSCFFAPEEIQVGQAEQELRAELAEGQANNECWYVRKDGTRFWATGVLTVLRDDSGNRQGFAKVLRDNTERKRTETERAQLLAREQQVRKQAEAANLSKDEFLTTLSHELRTPLTAILGWTRILRTKTLDEAGFDRALEVVERNAKSQVQLIEDLLDVSRIVTGKIRLNILPVQLAPVVQAAIETMRPAVEAKSIQLQVELDSEVGAVLGDPDRLQQVVWNLMSNAVKFTPKGGGSAFDSSRSAPAPSSPSATRAQGLAPDSCPTSSTDSAKPTTRPRDRTADSDWGSPSFAIWWNCTEERSMRKVPGRTRGRHLP